MGMTGEEAKDMFNKWEDWQKESDKKIWYNEYKTGPSNSESFQLEFKEEWLCKMEDEVMSENSQKLFVQKLEKQIPEGAYQIDDRMWTGKGGYIQLLLAFEMERRKIIKEGVRFEEPTFNIEESVRRCINEKS